MIQDATKDLTHNCYVSKIYFNRAGILFFKFFKEQKMFLVRTAFIANYNFGPGLKDLLKFVEPI